MCASLGRQECVGVLINREVRGLCAPAACRRHEARDACTKLTHRVPHLLARRKSLAGVKGHWPRELGAPTVASSAAGAGTADTRQACHNTRPRHGGISMVLEAARVFEVKLSHTLQP